ncbi:hypothetical protein C8J57DRAFT_512289 [Mycena rebaudengoi]|nr:hypothetical protein C8J57DRAFT_512289 [Mycena rebaudengoi]
MVVFSLTVAPSPATVVAMHISRWGPGGNAIQSRETRDRGAPAQSFASQSRPLILAQPATTKIQTVSPLQSSFSFEIPWALCPDRGASAQAHTRIFDPSYCSCNTWALTRRNEVFGLCGEILSDAAYKIDSDTCLGKTCKLPALFWFVLDFSQSLHRPGVSEV